MSSNGRVVPRPSEGEVLADWRPRVVRPQTPSQRVLYTWTTKEQAAQLRADHRLLVKTDGDGAAMSVYFQEHFAPVQDGLRWIEVSDPRSRRTDKLQIAGGSY